MRNDFRLKRSRGDLHQAFAVLEVDLDGHFSQNGVRLRQRNAAAPAATTTLPRRRRTGLTARCAKIKC